ncbi:MAG TPA: glycoside hydrolase family 3 C-terminal domain-containing protein [Steroidobacteraceae bacterium]|nr:glycoside hydrolase family 3 C-terminal domain-containing protein [Steroidobacteraceae bacterium]
MSLLGFIPARVNKIKLGLFTMGLIISNMAAAAEATPPYLDLNRSFEDRAADLVSRMTLEEKVLQMGNAAPAIPRLGVPEYEWWNEALHGVARAGKATVFPQAIGLAATFNPALVKDMATVISDEARAKYHEALRHDEHARYQGLTFWSPNINIFRDPRWGRGQETYGEDPFLTSRIGVAFVTGLQGDDPVYRKVDATAKHYAVHSGPEADRHHFDVHPSERDLYETYLPAFKALVQEGHVASVMGAYNRVNGDSASASKMLLQDILRKDWGFKGYVVSDCDSIEDIFKHHKIVDTAEKAAALGVLNGCNLDCGKTYDSLANAVKQGLIKESEIDASLRELFLTRFKLGMFDPPERVKWAQIPFSMNDSPAHDQLARKVAQQSIVLLKNGNAGKKPLLPLSKDLKSIAVIGPTADEIMSLLGNYYGTPSKPVTILQGIRDAGGKNTKVVYARGADLVEGREEPRAAPVIDAQYLRLDATSSEHGLKGEYFANKDLSGKPLMTRVDSRISFRWDRGSPTDDLVARGELSHDKAIPSDNFSVRWTGVLTPPTNGNYELTIGSNDGARLYIDDELLIDNWELSPRLSSKSVFKNLQAGKNYKLRVEYFEDIRDAEVRLAWRLPGAKAPFDEALDVARQSDVIIYVGGLTSDVEGEEMKTNFPGFAGGDRTDMKLPSSQQKLLEALQATGKPVVMVLTTGSALSIDWAKEKIPAILVAWYPGQRGGTAVADVLFGDSNPAGRLPITFYKSDAKLPAFDDYNMEGRTYRYYKNAVLYPFGYGLSYTQFKYSDLKLDSTSAKSSDTIKASLTVTNSGKVTGDEVVQLYVHGLGNAHQRAIKDLRGVERITLKPGESRRVEFSIKPDRDMTYYDVNKKAYAVDAGAYEIQLGASSSDIRLKQTLKVN